ncbi:MAG: hypothetical protein A2275_06860 [Bacteroidetes bacterium RIFOXYA12_FULL_35_11]|nr:MAG: hypothetical protein A2X01_15455 [Bacteroidetes bacterium GWF2_35_48]OFY76806.1 MAG: hypothetical protein A2275_06860 [Bacteroidetes bacterium RIFOXYA12_FULL_35_11]OFY97108.1 MAG: hypothetical protein A2309_01805 [Bacteroidetes bacterium RIFOXYB2_FULL_35_7]OFY98034.1 MAG: hypothetical protein A2491_18975 [Bacteroidetes bacterium RIFOXYC12_FULL_35_7]HBX49845.1 hypothetical protein [Bacteroidales bacterium]
MRNIIFVIVFIIASFSVYAQIPTNLPGWVTSIPKSNAKRIYSIGISDPKMEEGQAYQLALLRAKAMLAVFHQCTVQQAIDLYKSDKQDGVNIYTEKLEKLSKIYSKYIIDTTRLEIVNKKYTSDMEAIVLIREVLTTPDTCKFKDTLKVECISFLQEFRIDEASKSASNFSMAAIDVKGRTGDSLKFYFDCVDENNVDVSIASTFQDTIESSTSTMQEYENSTERVIDLAKYGGYSNMKKGIWKAYLDAVLQNIISASNMMISKNKTATDLYKSDTNSNYDNSKDENLNRNVSSNTLSVSLKSVEISKNKIWVDLKMEDYSKTPLKQKTDKIMNTMKKPLNKILK